MNPDSQRNICAAPEEETEEIVKRRDEVLRVAADKGLTLFKSSIAASGYKHVFLHGRGGCYYVKCVVDGKQTTYYGNPPWHIPDGHGARPRRRCRRRPPRRASHRSRGGGGG